MSDIDYDKALVLLSVVEKAVGHPQLRPIVNAATAELSMINQGCIDWLAEVAAEDKATEDAAKEEAAAKAAALAEKDVEDHPDSKPKAIPAAAEDKPAPVQRRI